MKKLILLAAIISTSYGTNAQSATLQQQIEKHIQNTVKFLDEKSKKNTSDLDYFRYAQQGKQEIISSDINHDGILDKIVVINFCERSNCHLTTNTTEVLIFTGQKNSKFNYSGSMFFSVYATVQVDKQKKVIINQYDYLDDDPHCCPSRLTQFELAIVSGKSIFTQLES